MRKGEKLRKELMQVAHSINWPAVRIQGFEDRVMARLDAAEKPEPYFFLIGWAARALAPGMAMILLVLFVANIMFQYDDLASHLTTFVAYVVFNVTL
jgi:hypothetical protein